MARIEGMKNHKVANASVFAAMMVVGIHTAGRWLDDSARGSALWFGRHGVTSAPALVFPRRTHGGVVEAGFCASLAIALAMGKCLPKTANVLFGGRCKVP